MQLSAFATVVEGSEITAHNMLLRVQRWARRGTVIAHAHRAPSAYMAKALMDAGKLSKLLEESARAAKSSTFPRHAHRHLG
jgi:hypothetical protein